MRKINEPITITITESQLREVKTETGILTYEQAREGRLRCWIYTNEVYSYREEVSKYWKLIINGKDVLEGKNAVSCRSCGNGVYNYKTKDGYWHHMVNGKDVLEGRNAVDAMYWGNGVYGYKTEDGYWHHMVNGKDILEGRRAIWYGYCGNGDYGYKDEDGHIYIITKNTEGGIEYKKREEPRRLTMSV